MSVWPPHRHILARRGPAARVPRWSQPGGQAERGEHRRLFEGRDVGQGDQRLRVGSFMRGDEPLEQAAKDPSIR
jgi:hypothetical protein